jgi:signal transduction histidine kinase
MSNPTGNRNTLDSRSDLAGDAARGDEASSLLAAEALGEVVGRIAREIGAPLTAIEVAVDRLRRHRNEVKSAVGERGDEELQVILEQSHRLAGLARTLLSLARPTEARSRLVPLDELVTHTLSALEPDLRRWGIDVRLHHDVPGLTIWGDPHQIREALSALLLNARLALQDWHGERVIRIQTGALEGQRAFVRVADTGPGVPTGKEDRIFLPFFSEWGREGIGLARSRIALMAQGGHIVLDGPGLHTGAAFTLILSGRRDHDEEDLG